MIFATGAAVTGILTGILRPTLGPKSWALTYDYFSPAVIAMSIAVFVGVSRSCPPWAASRRNLEIIAWISDCSLGIYLVHPLWIRWLCQGRPMDLLLAEVWAVPVFTLGVFLVSAATTAVMRRVPIVKMAV